MDTTSAQLLLDARATVGEGPIWDAAECALWWVDIEQHLLHRFDPRDGTNDTIDVGQRVGAVVPRQGGGLMLATERGFVALDPNNGHQQNVADPEADVPQNRFNDGKCDPAGRFWAGTMEIAEQNMTAGSLYCLHHDGRVTRHLSEVGVSNGIVWSSDRRTMYYIDSPTRRIDAFDYNEQTGEIANRRVELALPEEMGFPDGMAIDTCDRLWIALWGGWGVACYDPAEREIVGRIPVPAEQVSACAFGGSELNHLFITTARRGVERRLERQPNAGGLFVAMPGVRGVQANCYAG